MWVIIEGSNTPQITNIFSWQSTHRLNRIGSARMVMPANDPLAANINIGSVLLCYEIVGGSPALLGTMVVGRIAKDAGLDGIVNMRIEGDDVLGELTRNTVKELRIAQGDAHENEVSNYPLRDVLGFSDNNPNSWRVTGNSTLSSGVYALFSGNTVFDTLSQLASKTAENFRFNQILSNGDRELYWYGQSQGSRILTAVADGNIDSPELCLVDNISELTLGQEVATRIYPYGAGNAHSRITLLDGTEGVPSGFTINRDQNYIERVGVSPRIERSVSFKDILPMSNRPAAFRTASNTLAKVAVNYLVTRRPDQKVYNLTISAFDRLPLVGERIRIDYTGFGLSVDTELTIIEVSLRSEFILTADLVVSTVNTYDTAASADGSIVANSIIHTRDTDSIPQVLYTYNTYQNGRQEVDTRTDAELLAIITDDVLDIVSARLLWYTTQFYTVHYTAGTPAQEATFDPITGEPLTPAIPEVAASFTLVTDDDNRDETQIVCWINQERAETPRINSSHGRNLQGAFDITSILREKEGGVRGQHTIYWNCTSGKRVLFATLELVLSIQPSYSHLNRN